MIGMALVAAASVLAASTQASTASIVDEELTADLVVQSATFAVPAEVPGRMADVAQVASVDALSVAQVQVQGTDGETWRTPVLGLDPAIFGRSMDVEVISGDLASLDRGELAVQRSVAEDRGWAIGDELTVSTDGTSDTAPIGAVLDSRALGTPVVLPTSVFADLVPVADAVIDTVMVNGAPGADLEQLRADLTDLVRPYVVLSVLDGADFAAQLADQVDQVLVILYALLGLSVVIAVLGIVNTLALSVIERTREVGLLRAVGLGRMQLAGTVTIESVLTAVFGTALGLLVGVGLAAAMPSVFADEGLSVLAVPWASLGLMLALAVGVGVLAAVWPAVRAARLPVLDAVSYE
jgi:putative ABC transport system permease protein